ncbi:uncharacterized protein LOC119772117 [Cyprinodon tularosa]|uniref:uncharacterized protein LOC119772117 n=1 Tax=Cyprinodon tularosa TaxID=77115 RepID=UPI0018E1FF45|nr:uncharacterized protein LOC119772117 [Cyprinodon tularosa]
MTLLLIILLLLCARSYWGVLSDANSVIQSPDLSVLEGETLNISCCWSNNTQRTGIQWLKNQSLIKTETVNLHPGGSQTDKPMSCSLLMLTNITSRDSGTYICKITVEIPVLDVFEGSGTTITVTTPVTSTAGGFLAQMQNTDTEAGEKVQRFIGYRAGFFLEGREDKQVRCRFRFQGVRQAGWLGLANHNRVKTIRLRVELSSSL